MIARLKSFLVRLAAWTSSLPAYGKYLLAFAVFMTAKGPALVEIATNLHWPGVVSVLGHLGTLAGIILVLHTEIKDTQNVLS